METLDNRVTIYPNGQIHYDLYIKPFADVTMKPVKFIFDTGVGTCMIDLIELQKLGYTEKWVLQNGVKKTVNQANKTKIENCYVVKLPQITIGKHSFNNFNMITSTTERLNQLLGLNFIRLCDWDISYKKNYAEFTLIKQILAKAPGDFEAFLSHDED
ncbi:MAG: retroviral-like aspartic protease family protein [Turicibacter sp.]|nr:retroviral-like aspartic protease family protein [Turicibacter sp.]